MSEVPQISDANRRAALEELASRRILQAKIRAGLFDRQQEVLAWKGRWLAVTCGRRAGKTSLLIRMIILALLECNRNERVGYATVTQKSARQLIWGELKMLIEELGLVKRGWRILENDGEIHTPRGGIFHLFGFDQKEALERARGFKFRLFALDEIATVAAEAEYIVDESVGPALMDLGGKLIVCGTPGPALDGWWYETSNGLRPEFSCFSWNAYDNKLFPTERWPHLTPQQNAHLALEEVLKEKQWTRDTPKFVREYLGKWLTDASALVYGDYDPARCKVLLGSVVQGPDWRYYIGADYGVTDPCAWVVFGVPPEEQVTYVVETRKRAGLSPSAAADITRDLVVKYKPVGVYGDAAGKSYIIQFNDRYGEELGCYVEPCDKTDKVGQIETVNGQYRGRRLLLLGDHPELEKELLTHLWADKERTKTPKRANDHLLDAKRYGLLKFTSDTNKAPMQGPEALRWKEFDARMAAAKERREMEQEASEERTGAIW